LWNGRAGSNSALGNDVAMSNGSGMVEARHLFSIFATVDRQHDNYSCIMALIAAS
jgi:hypothetical protein